MRFEPRCRAHSCRPACAGVRHSRPDQPGQQPGRPVPGLAACGARSSSWPPVAPAGGCTWCCSTPARGTPRSAGAAGPAARAATDVAARPALGPPARPARPHRPPGPGRLRGGRQPDRCGRSAAVGRCLNIAVRAARSAGDPVRADRIPGCTPCPRAGSPRRAAVGACHRRPAPTTAAEGIGSPRTRHPGPENIAGEGGADHDERRREQLTVDRGRRQQGLGRQCRRDEAGEQPASPAMISPAVWAAAAMTAAGRNAEQPQRRQPAQPVAARKAATSSGGLATGRRSGSARAGAPSVGSRSSAARTASAAALRSAPQDAGDGQGAAAERRSSCAARRRWSVAPVETGHLRCSSGGRRRPPPDHRSIGGAAPPCVCGGDRVRNFRDPAARRARPDAGTGTR